MKFATFVLLYALLTGAVCFSTRRLWVQAAALGLSGYFAAFMLAAALFFSATGNLTESGEVCVDRICAETPASCFSALGGTVLYEPMHPALLAGDVSVFDVDRAGPYALPDGGEVFWVLFFTAVIPFTIGLIGAIAREGIDSRRQVFVPSIVVTAC